MTVPVTGYSTAGSEMYLDFNGSDGFLSALGPTPTPPPWWAQVLAWIGATVLAAMGRPR